MKALVFYDIGDIRLEEVSKPKLQKKFDAIVRITLSAICSTDLPFIRGTIAPMKKEAIFGIDIADVKPGKVVVVLGCRPVGQFVIASCKLI